MRGRSAPRRRDAPPDGVPAAPAERDRSDFAASIESTVLAESRRNELTLGWVRAAAMTLIAVADVWQHLAAEARHEPYPVSIPLLSGGWAAISLVIVLALRRGFYRPALRLLLPLADAGATFTILFNLVENLGHEHYLRLGALGNLGAASALLAVSGSLRLTRQAAVLTTALGVAIFVFFSWRAGVVSAQTVVGVAILIATGLLGVNVARVVRRAVRSEIARMTLRRFLPERVIDEAHDDPLSLLTSPRSADATVVVTDLRRFTALSERLAPAEVLAFLNEVQGALAAAVRARGGTVDKFMGDGMLAVFGVPEPLASHALQALLAVEDMLGVIDRINERRVARGEAPVGIGIGVHSGPVVAGCLGSGQRLEFTVIGDVVNAASRLEALTKELGVMVLVSAEVVERAAPGGVAGALEPKGQVELRGRSEPLAVFTLAAARGGAAPPAA
ncbi:MAG: adenylate/guanylate cyclase domain-containing protein [Sandaracinaceae bacterium]|nr:adenylate/guanylate cyclase domain-containing protein [Sandaracinaceae bacterium]